MLSDDPANSRRASYRPDIAGGIDTPRDILAEPFLLYSGPLPTLLDAFRRLALQLLDAGLANLDDPPARAAPSQNNGIVQLLQLLTGDTDSRLAIRAHCYLRLLNLESLTFAQIGEKFGVHRATIHAEYRKIQKLHPAMHARGDKSDRAREACRRRRIGARNPAIDWPAASIWKRPQFLSQP